MEAVITIYKCITFAIESGFSTTLTLMFFYCQPCVFLLFKEWINS